MKGNVNQTITINANEIVDDKKMDISESPQIQCTMNKNNTRPRIIINRMSINFPLYTNTPPDKKINIWEYITSDENNK